ncbi:MAG: CDP-alcohol phosphatidyltransferase family protein [Candidatus Omnitrophota bacterium]
MNWANRLTICRIILVPAFILFVLYHRLDIAFFVFITAAVTDGLDGYIARTKNMKTRLGAVLDPIADKLLIDTAFVSFSLVSGLPQYLKMPVYVPIVVISRDVIILLGAAVIYLLSGKIKIKPSRTGKLTTFAQMLTVICILLRFVYSNWVWNIMIVLTIVSGLDYIRTGSRQINGKI